MSDRRLVVCCDGTWNAPTLQSVTNVYRLYNALAQKGTGDTSGEQLCYYQPGVGTRGTLLSWMLGGIAGTGLPQDIMDAYRWVTTNYQEGDTIALFGFSRGAYTARSLAAMIASCGLLDTIHQDARTVRENIQHVYDKKYRPLEPDPSWRDGLRFSLDPDEDVLPISFVGVWDTVGALGIPSDFGLLKLAEQFGLLSWLMGSPNDYRFRDLKLDPRIPTARHAIAMDERRTAFTPAPWDTQKDESRQDIQAHQDIQQVYFPGSHMDVGGGNPETGLSDGALQWMIDEAEATGVGFEPPVLSQIHPNPEDALHEDNRRAFRFLGPLYDALVDPLLQPVFKTRPRKVPQIKPIGGPRTQALHRSAYARHDAHIITTRPYRPARVLQPGRSETVEVLAREPWNDTGLYLETGCYSFVAEGEWQDGPIWSGPEGTTGLARFNPLSERLRLVGTAFTLAERLFRTASRNQSACLFGARREGDQPWMSLVGVISNEGGSPLGPVQHDRQPVSHDHQHISIGKGTDGCVRVTDGGYLYAYANDAWGFYSNNKSSVRLTVTRVQCHVH